jgi:hypothetical protein
MRFRCLSLLVLFLIAGVGLFAQTSSLSGTVVDPSGALIPGADVVVKNNATGATFRTVTEGDGAFRVPALGTGDYSVTVYRQGV